MAAKWFLERYVGGLYEILFDAYTSIKFWKFSSSAVLLQEKLYIEKQYFM
jgi:hypothetical protein